MQRDWPTCSKKPCLSSSTSSLTAEKTNMYKKNLKFNFKWKDKWKWIECSLVEGGVFGEMCKKLDTTTISMWSKGDKANKKWIKATELLRQHDKSGLHLASVRQLMSSLASTSGGGICERMLSIGEKEVKNRKLVKILFIKVSLFFDKEPYSSHNHV